MEKNISNCEAICVTKEEKEVIADMRSLEFGKIAVVIQNGCIISREVTKTIRNGRNGNSQAQRDLSKNIE